MDKFAAKEVIKGFMEWNNHYDGFKDKEGNVIYSYNAFVKVCNKFCSIKLKLGASQIAVIDYFTAQRINLITRRIRIELLENGILFIDFLMIEIAKDIKEAGFLGQK